MHAGCTKVVTEMVKELASGEEHSKTLKSFNRALLFLPRPAHPLLYSYIRFPPARAPTHPPPPDLLVVDYWADWCGPCIRFAPTYDEIARSVTSADERVKFFKLKESSPGAGEELQARRVKAFPTFALYIRDREVARVRLRVFCGCFLAPCFPSHPLPARCAPHTPRRR